MASHGHLIVDSGFYYKPTTERCSFERFAELHFLHRPKFLNSLAETFKMLHPVNVTKVYFCRKTTRVKGVDGDIKGCSLCVTQLGGFKIF